MNKGLYKFAGVSAIVIGVIYSITIVGLIIGIPLIIGGSIYLDYEKLSARELKMKSSSILGWTIFFFIFAVIPGILSFISYLELTDKPIIKPNNSLRDQLLELDALLEEKIITKTEYNKRRKKIIEE